MSTSDVALALRNTSKGQLRYDHEWKPTTLELDAVSSPPCISSRWTDFLNDFSGLHISKNRSFNIPCYTNEKEEYLNKDPIEKNSLDEDKFQKKRDEKEIKPNEDIGRKRNAIAFVDNDVGVHIGLYEYEKDMEEKKKQAIKDRKQKFRIESFKLSHKAEESLQEITKEKILEHDKDYHTLKEFEEKCVENFRRKHLVLQQAHREQAQRQSDIHNQLVSRERERQEIAVKAMKKVESLLEEITSIGEEVQKVIRNCKHPKFLQRELVRKIFAEFQTIYHAACEHVKKAKTDHFQAPNFIKKMEDLVNALKTLLSTAKTICNDAENKGAKEEAEIKAKAEAEKRRKEAEKAAKEAAEAKAKAEKESQAKAAEVAANSVKSTKPNSSDMTAVAAVQKHGRFEDYLTYQNFLDEISKKCETLSTSKDKEQKKFLFNLKLAIKSPINAIADTSAAHLIDKIKSLSSLLSGQTVRVAGKQVNVNSYPEAQFLCQELVARSFVMQGVSQVSSSSDSAYCIAAVAVGVWHAHPQMGQLMLAHFYKMCPYLVPFYIPRLEGQRLEEYRRTQGYDDKDGKVEENDKFLQRMAGIVRLYAAIMSSLPPPGVTTHPFSIDHGWTLLAHILNLEPQVDITATVLFNFLEVAGHSLMARFKKQFQKLLLILCEEYIPKIEKITPKQNCGPVSRLKIFLETCIGAGTISVPKKYLTQQWWRS